MSLRPDLTARSAVGRQALPLGLSVRSQLRLFPGAASTHVMQTCSSCDSFPPPLCRASECAAVWAGTEAAQSSLCSGHLILHIVPRGEREPGTQRAVLPPSAAREARHGEEGGSQQGLAPSSLLLSMNVVSLKLQVPVALSQAQQSVSPDQEPLPEV